MKKHLKIFLAVMVLVAMATSLVGCGNSAKPADSSTSAEAEATGLKVCIITSSGIDDGSFNQNCYEGILDFVESHPDCTVTDIKEPEYNEMIPTVERVVGDYDAFVLPGFNFAAVGDIVLANPDKYFMVVDSTITDSNKNPVSADNLYTMTFLEQEGGFFAGVAAALSTKTNKVAVVNAVAFPSNVNYQYGFMAGVNYCNATYGTDVSYVELPSYAGSDLNGNDVGGNYTGDFADEATGKVVGEALIDAGCDVLFVAAGASGNGVFTAVKEADDVYAIGCDADQYEDGANGDANIILTSALKVMDINVEKQLTAIYDETFVGEDAVLGASTDSMSYVAADEHQQLSDDALTKLADVYELVKSGEIVPPSNFNDFMPDNFPGLN